MSTSFQPFAVGAISALAALPFVVQAPAQAAACPQSTNTANAPTTASEFKFYADVFTPSFSCTIGDKIFSNFKDPSTALASLNTRPSNNGKPRFWFSEDSANMTYNMFWGIASAGSAIPSGTYDFTFDVEVSQVSPTPVFYIDSATYTRTGGTSPSISSISIAAQNVLPPYPKLVTYTTSVTLGGGSTTTRAFKVGIVQDMVPRPLPIIGASVAFGYSRKLRRRTRMFA